MKRMITGVRRSVQQLPGYRPLGHQNCGWGRLTEKRSCLAIVGLFLWSPFLDVQSEMTLKPIVQPMAPQSDVCYMVLPSGQRLSLGGLCGEVPMTVRNPSKPEMRLNGQPDPIYRAKIKRRIAATPVIEVVFNGQHRFEMILDTGASGTLITQTMAQALKIQPTGAIQAGIADGSVVEMRIGQVQSMSVGGLTTQNLEVAIAPPSLRGRSPLTEVGLLGYDFFGNYDIKIRRDTIEFYPRVGG